MAWSKLLRCLLNWALILDIAIRIHYSCPCLILCLLESDCLVFCDLEGEDKKTSIIPGS
jgi:hypothetical protein